MNDTERTFRAGSRWYWAIPAVYLVGLLWVGSALRNNIGFPLDDSWIHQVIARNLVQFHTWGFTPGVSSSGSSSTLWTLILALGQLLFSHASPVYYPLLLNAALLIGCGLLLWWMAVADGLPRIEVLALAVLPGLSGNMVWLVFTSMEHVLFVFLSLLAIVAWFHPGRGRMSSVGAGLAMGALEMTRPEGLVLCVILLALYKRCGRSAWDIVRAGCVSLLFLLASFAINLRTSGTLMPATMRGRRFLYTGSVKLHFGRSSVRALTGETYERIIGHHFFHSTAWWVALFVALAFYGLFVLLRRFPNRTAVVCLWAVVHYACYCVVLPAAGHGGRYQPFVLLLFPPLMAIGLVDLARRSTRFFPGRTTTGVQWVAVAAIALITVTTLPRWRTALADSIFEINGSPRKLAYWINDHCPPGSVMAVSDIGAIGYFAHIKLIDLGGLVDAHFFDYLLSGRVPEYIQARGAEYVVLAHNPDDPQVGEMFHLLHNPAVRLTPIHTEGIDERRWESGNLYTQHGFRFQTLYRIDYFAPGQQSAAATAAATAVAVGARPDSEALTH